MVRHQFERAYAMLYKNILLKHYRGMLGLQIRQDFKRYSLCKAKILHISKCNKMQNLICIDVMLTQVQALLHTTQIWCHQEIDTLPKAAWTSYSHWSVLMGPYSFTVKWKSTTQHNQNEMEASLSLCKHTTQTTDGGRRRRFVERRDTRWGERRDKWVTTEGGEEEGDSGEGMEIATSAVSCQRLQ